MDKLDTLNHGLLQLLRMKRKEVEQEENKNKEVHAVKQFSSSHHDRFSGGGITTTRKRKVREVREIREERKALLKGKVKR